jgi:hypothetical protein
MTSAVWLASAVADWAGMSDFFPQPATPMVAATASPIAKYFPELTAIPQARLV